MKRLGAEISTSVTAELNDNTSVLIGYEGKFRLHYQDHTGMVNVKHEF
ncbi:MAG: autotransporter outer membrane beta-barrel domain-containing protein [Alphaproteobacteria bacterium]|nr:autotransporter outer membrane beta-barrel domain-containing protein [Alphaproteobacteria bacterium]